MRLKDYDLELEKVRKKIKDSGAKKVLVELPDGLKPFATEIVEKLKKTDAEIYIWADTCFGACDVPRVDFDLTIQFGHNAFIQ